MKKKKNQKTEFSSFISLKDLLEDLHANGVTKKDFNKVEFELDYGGCYYEGDTASIVAKLNK